MKIAILNIYGDRVSRGAEVAVREIAKRLAKLHNVTVYQTGNSPFVTVPYEKVTINYIPILSTDVSYNIFFRFLKKFYLDPYSLIVLLFTIRLLPYLFKKSYDVIIPINGFWQIILCKLIKLMRGSKIVVFGYAGIGIDDYINLKLNPDAFFAMTHMAKKWAQEVNRSIPIRVLAGGVNTNLFRPDVKPIVLPLKRPIVIAVAALVPYKNVDLTIKAVHLLPNVSLVVAGNGILKEQIEKLGQKLLPNRFLRIDINYAQLPSLYRAGDAFTLASMHKQNSLFFRVTKTTASEAFGIVYLEAMACGLPVVAPDDQLRREIVGNAGILTDCTDSKQYAQAINEALNKKWGPEPMMQAKKFDWDKIVRDFEKDLREVTQ